MLADIAKRKGRIDYVVFYNVSRISRDMTSFFNDIDSILAKCGVTLRSTQEVIDESPTGHFMLNIALSVHQIDNDIKSKTVKDDMSLLASYGWWLSQAPLGLKLKPIVTGGYTNDGKKNHHNTLEIDETNDIGKNIQFLLNRFSEGDIAPMELVNLTHKMGVNDKNGKPITLNTMLGVLRQSVYAGYNTPKNLLDSKPTKIKDFDGLIDIDTFNKNQRILSGKRAPLAPSNSELYPLRKLLIYSKCGTLIRSSVPRSSATQRARASTAPQGDIRYRQEAHRDSRRYAIDSKITIDDKNRYSEALEQKRQDLRREVDKLEHNQGLNEATIDYVCNFMTKPAKLWKDADLETR